MQSMGSRAYHLSCPEACGIFLDQELNPCPLHWQAVLNHWATRKVPLGGILEPTSHRQ